MNKLSFIITEKVTCLNVQDICDVNPLLTYLVVRWPRYVHDSTIFSNSYYRAQFETGIFSESNILLGNCGYALKLYLMTPLLNLITQGEVTYNTTNIKPIPLFLYKVSRFCILLVEFSLRRIYCPIWKLCIERRFRERHFNFRIKLMSDFSSYITFIG